LIESTVCPEIRAHIEELEVATPLTMMRYLNSPGGAIYGFNQNATDSALIRDRLNTVEGLYFAGSWTSMGGFQPTYTAGVSTARAVVKTLQKQELEHV
jgi:prolycopene isomerase